MVQNSQNPKSFCPKNPRIEMSPMFRRALYKPMQCDLLADNDCMTLYNALKLVKVGKGFGVLLSLKLIKVHQQRQVQQPWPWI